MSGTSARIRERRPGDLPALASALLAQQAATRYPFRDPLPVPVAAFLHADDAVRAWTADLGGDPVGHVCRTAPDPRRAVLDPLDAVCADAHACAVSDLGWVRALFVAAEVRGTGLGRRLLDTVVDDLRVDGRRPCLEVLPTHPDALRLYLAHGWRVVRRLRPAWLREAAGESGPDVLVMVLDEARG